MVDNTILHTGYVHSPDVVVIDGIPIEFLQNQEGISMIFLGLEDCHPIDPVTETEADRVVEWECVTATYCHSCKRRAYLYDGYCVACVQENYDRQAAAFGHLG